MNLILNRLPAQNDKQLIGNMRIEDDAGRSVFNMCTLELPWRENQRRVSCIPEGTYEVVRRESRKFGEHFHILNVPERDFILIHSGNFHYQIQGCILVGSEWRDIDGDNIVDVTNSRNTMKKLLDLLPEKFTITIS